MSFNIQNDEDDNDEDIDTSNLTESLLIKYKLSPILKQRSNSVYLPKDDSDLINKNQLKDVKFKLDRRVTISNDDDGFQMSSIKNTSQFMSKQKMDEQETRKNRNEEMIRSQSLFKPEQELNNVNILFYFSDYELQRESLKHRSQFKRLIRKLDYVALWLPILNPTSNLMIIWKIIQTFIILFFFLEIPMFQAFGNIFWMTIMSFTSIRLLMWFTVLMLFSDMALEFITAYYEHGNLVMRKSKIAYNYFRKNFPYDAIAIITFTIRVSFPTDDYRWIYFFFYFKIFWIIKVDQQFGEMLLIHRDSRSIYGVSKILMELIFYFQIFGCNFYILGTWSVKNGLNSWLLNSGNFGIILNMDIHDQLFYSFYFSLGTMSTTMGYGDITPLNIYECTYCLCGIMCAVLVFALNINIIQQIADEYHFKEMKNFQSRIAINRFMNSKNVPPQLCERVRQYLNEHWYMEMYRDVELEQTIVQELAPELREELIFSAYGSHFIKQPIMSIFSNQLLRELSINVKEIHFSQGEIIFEDHNHLKSTSNSIYYINEGSIEIYPELKYKNKSHNVLLNKLKNGESFGEWGFITGYGRKASAKSHQFSHLYELRRIDFLDALTQFPNDFELFYQLRDNLIFNENRLKFINQQCWTCESLQHYATECPTSHYLPEIGTLFSEQSINSQQDRIQYERVKTEKWKTKKNLSLLVKITKRSRVQKTVQKIISIKNVAQSIFFENSFAQNNSREGGQLQKELQKQFGVFWQTSAQKELVDIDKAKQYKFYFQSNNIQNFWNDDGQLKQQSERTSSFK